MGFPGGSDGKESACNAGDPGLILGSGRSPGEGNGYPLKESDMTERLTLSLSYFLDISKQHRDVPGGPVVKTTILWQVAWVRPLVTSHRLCSTAKKTNTNTQA